MRPRTKTKGLIVHSDPKGKANFSKEAKVNRQITKLESLIKEGYKLTDARKVEEPKDQPPKKLVITVSGWEALGTLTITFKDYENDYKDKPITVVKKIY